MAPRFALALGLVGVLSACQCETELVRVPDGSATPSQDAGVDAGDSGVDAGDSGVDAGDSGVDAGDSGVDAGDLRVECVILDITTFVVDGGEISSTAVGLTGDGSSMAVKFGAEQLGLDQYWRAALLYRDGGVWIHPLPDTEVRAISNAGFAGSTGASSGVPAIEGFRQKFGGDFEVLSDAPIVGSVVYGINDDLIAVGTVSTTAAIWGNDGGPGAVYPPEDSGYVRPDFRAINSSGVIVGYHAPVTPEGIIGYSFVYSNGEWTSLECPGGCFADAISEKYVGGSRNFLGRGGPTRWWLADGGVDWMETAGSYIVGRVSAVRDDDVSGGVLARLTAQTPQDGRGALWSGTALAWLADVDAGAAELTVVQIVGLASTAEVAAAQCYRGDIRVACMLSFHCGVVGR